MSFSMFRPMARMREGEPISASLINRLQDEVLASRTVHVDHPLTLAMGANGTSIGLERSSLDIRRFKLTEDLASGSSADAMILYYSSGGTYDRPGESFTVYDSLGEADGTIRGYEDDVGFCKWHPDSGRWEVLGFGSGQGEDGVIYAKITAFRDTVTPIEYSWVQQDPTTGGNWTNTSGGMSGTCRAYVRIATTTAGGTVNEVQSVAIIGATSGTFTLTYDGQTTSALAYNISAGSLETALEALSNITAVSVSGSGTYASPFLVTFQDSTSNVPQMTATITDLLPSESRNEAYECNDTPMAVDDIVILWRGYGRNRRVEITKIRDGNNVNQTVQLEIRVHDAESGTWTLTWEGETTAAIAYNASASTVASAILGLAFVSVVTVTGTGTDVDPYIVTLGGGDFAPHPIPTANVSSLYGTLDYRFIGVSGVTATKTVVTAVSCNAGALSVTTESWRYVNGLLISVT